MPHRTVSSESLKADSTTWPRGTECWGRPPADLDAVRGIKHVWEADGWPFAEMPELNEEIVSVSGKMIVLIRRNWLRRVVSNYLCRHTGVWFGTRSDFLAR